MKQCFLLIVAGILVFAFASQAEARALSTKNFQGECISKYKAWKKRGGFGAAALATNGYCGFSWDYNSVGEAIATALSLCRTGKKGKACVMVAQINELSDYKKNAATCNSGNPQMQLEACTWLINSKRDKGLRQAWYYNERGRAYQFLGNTNLAIVEFSNAVKAEKTYGAAYYNLARLERERGQLDLALANIKRAVKYYENGDDDYRIEANGFIRTITSKLASLPAMTKNQLCTASLGFDKTTWEISPDYAPEVQEAKKRGLTVETCRQTLGYP